MGAKSFVGEHYENKPRRRQQKNKANLSPREQACPSDKPLGASSGQALSSVEWSQFRNNPKDWLCAALKVALPGPFML